MFTSSRIAKPFLGLICLCTLGCPRPAAQGAEVKLGELTFTVPDGFTVELVAGPPLTDRPIVADFDEEGRLYVADSSGSNDKVEKQLVDRTHRIVQLTDTDQDGRFDRSTVFADKMMFPEGVLWFDGAVYSGAPPSIWKLEDTDRDGKVDRRSEWFKGGTLTGCANDLHGPYLGPDGWIYWAKGAFAKQTHDRPGRPTISDSAAHIFRARPDGTDLDSVMSGGMDNPVEVAFTRAGDAIFTTTFYTNPEAGKRDALVHAVYGGVFPKIHGVLDGLKRTGELLPPLTHLGPAVPSGLTRYQSRSLGAEFQDNLFSSQFNMHRIQRHVLEPAGATYRSRDLDFLTCDNPDFHPTDVLEDADGSLLVIDTGGWYKLCCPSSQIAKPEVLGGIYRIRRTGAPVVVDPRGLKLSWPSLRPTELTRLLDDPRPAVRERSIRTLAKTPVKAVPALKNMVSRPGKHSPEARRNAVWALCRISGPEARAAVRSALEDPDLTVRQCAIHAAGLWRDRLAVPAILASLRQASPALQRASATALGQIGAESAVPDLLIAAARSPDRFLEHSLIYAMIQIGAPEPLRDLLARASADPALVSSKITAPALRAALIALDQMDNGRIESKLVLPWLSSSNPLLRESAMWVAVQHPDWGDDLTAFFNKQLSGAQPSAGARDELRAQLAKFARAPAIQELLVRFLKPETPAPTRRLILGAMAQAGIREVPLSWTQQLRETLTDRDEGIVADSIAAIRALPVAKTNAVDYSDSLGRIGRDSSRPSRLRLDALAAVSPGLQSVDDSLFEFLRQSLNQNRPAGERAAAAAVLARAKLSADQLVSLTGALGSTGALELSRLVPVFEQTNDEIVLGKLLNALHESKTAAQVFADSLKSRLARLPEKLRQEAEAMLQSADSSFATQKAHLEEISRTLAAGDKARGHLIFNKTQTACATCHAIGYLGGRIGPDLTRIGAVRTERDLLESILFPSASFVRSYEPMIVKTKAGDELSGVMKQEASDTVLLVSGPNAEQRLARADIADIRPGSVSVMPAGLEQQLNAQDLADLIAFLKSLK